MTWRTTTPPHLTQPCRSPITISRSLQTLAREEEELGGAPGMAKARKQKGDGGGTGAGATVLHQKLCLSIDMENQLIYG